MQYISNNTVYLLLFGCLLLVAHAGNADEDHVTKLQSNGPISTESGNPIGRKFNSTKMKTLISNDSLFADVEHLVDLYHHIQTI